MAAADDGYHPLDAEPMTEGRFADALVYLAANYETYPSVEEFNEAALRLFDALVNQRLETKGYA